MQKRNKLEVMLREIADDEFGAIWHDTYGFLPEGSRSELARDFVAEQYDGELDGCIAGRISSDAYPKAQTQAKEQLAPAPLIASSHRQFQDQNQ